MGSVSRRAMPTNLALLAFGSYPSIDAFAQTGVLPKEGPAFQTVSFSGFTTR